MPIVPRVSTPDTQQAPRRLPDRNVQTSPDAFGAAQAGATTQAGGQIAQAGQHLFAAGQRIQDREDSVTMARTLQAYREDLTNQFLEVEGNGDNFETRASVDTYAKYADDQVKALVTSSNMGGRSRAILEERLLAIRGQAQDLAVTRHSTASRAAVTRELGKQLNSVLTMVETEPTRTADARLAARDRIMNFQGQFTPDETATHLETIDELISMKALDFAMTHGRTRDLQDAFESEKTFLSPKTRDQYQTRILQRQQAEAAEEAKVNAEARARFQLIESGSVPNTPETRMWAAGLPVGDTLKIQANLEAYARVVGEPASKEMAALAFGVHLDPKDQTKVDQFNAYATRREQWVAEGHDVKIFDNFMGTLMDPDKDPSAWIANFTTLMKRAPTEQETQVYFGLREKLREPKPTLQQEHDEWKAVLTAANNGVPPTAEQTAVKFGGYVAPSDKKLTLGERWTDFKTTAAQEGWVPTFDHFLMLSNAYVGADKTSATVEKIAEGRKLLASGEINDEEFKKYVGAHIPEKTTRPENPLGRNRLETATFMSDMAIKIARNQATPDEKRLFLAGAASMEQVDPETGLRGINDPLVRSVLKEMGFPGGIVSEEGGTIDFDTSNILGGQGQAPATAQAAPAPAAPEPATAAPSPAASQPAQPAPEPAAQAPTIQVPDSAPTDTARPSIQEELGQVQTQRDEQIGGKLDQATATTVHSGVQELNEILKLDVPSDPRGEVVRPKQTAYELANLLTGPVSGAKSALSRNILTRWAVQAPEIREAREFMQNWVNTFALGIRENTRSETERANILARLDLAPSFFDSPDDLLDRLVGLDDFLANKEAVALQQTKAKLPKKDKQMALGLYNNIRHFRRILIPPKIDSDEQFDAMLQRGELQPGDVWRDADKNLFRVLPEDVE